jgi:KRAB domain-containing zinc finger protein
MSIHTNTLDFECSFCSKQFRTKGQLTVHLRSHTKEKNFACSHCSASFSHRESLLTHNSKFVQRQFFENLKFNFLLSALHTGIKRFECSSCGRRFSCISNLISHRKSNKSSCGDSQIQKVTEAENSVRICKVEVLPEVKEFSDN